MLRSCDKKYGEGVLFDERMGLSGWKNKRESEEIATKLKGSAVVEIESNKDWKEHIIEYADGIEGNKVRVIDIGIALYSEEYQTKRKTSESSSSNELQQTIQKKKPKKKTVKGFCAPKEVILQVLSQRQE